MYTVEMIKTAGANAGLSPQELNFLCQQLKIRYGSEPQQNSGNTNVLRSFCDYCETELNKENEVCICKDCREGMH